MDKLSPKRRSENMRAIRGKGMKPEMIVRKLIHGMGFRYRLHRKDLPGKPDLVFSSRQKLIQVHGCFWHQHNDPNCKIVRVPKSNQDYWLKKLERNKSRDKENQSLLQELGWEVMVIWECQTQDANWLKSQLHSFLSK